MTFRPADRDWALTWAALHLAGACLGGWFGAMGTTVVGATAIPLEATVRVSALLPVVAILVPRLRAGVWLSVFLLATAWGASEGSARRERTTAVAPAPAAPSVRVTRRAAATFRITGWCSRNERDRWRGPAYLVGCREGTTTGRPLDLRPGDGVLLNGEGEVPPPGELVAGIADFSVPAAATLPGAFDYRQFLAGRGIRWQARFAGSLESGGEDALAVGGRTLLGPLRTGLLDRIRAALPVRESDSMSAVLLGARTTGSRQTSRPFADLGLAHLFAVSGLHVGILVAILLAPATVSGAPPGLRVGPLLAFLPLYAVLTGLSGSVTRAAGLGCLGLGAQVIGRRADSLRLVGVLFWAGTVWNPVQVLDAGTRLSYLAAAGILIVGRALRGRGERTRLALVRAVTGGLQVSLAAQWFTLPQVAASFGRISLLSPLANLVVVPWFGVAVWISVLGLGVGAVWRWAGEALWAWAWLLLRGMGGLVALVSSGTGRWALDLPVPGALPVAGWFAATVAVWHLVRSGGGTRILLRRITIPGLAGLVLLTFSSSAGPKWGSRAPSAWLFDVGQGDCILVQFPDRWRVLVDTGGTFGVRKGAEGPVSRTVIPYLSRQGIHRLDCVVLTHGHWDHTGGAGAVADGLAVGRWLCGGRSAEVLTGREGIAVVRSLRAGAELHRWRDWSIRILHSYPLPAAARTENNESLVTGLFHNERCVLLLSGDLEVEGEERLIGPDLPRGVQVWKAGHHGSDTSGSARFLEHIDPQLVLISCGVGNRYAHPSHGPYHVQNDTIGFLRTDLAGSIRFQWDEDGRLLWRAPAAVGLPSGRLDFRDDRF